VAHGHKLSSAPTILGFCGIRHSEFAAVDQSSEVTQVLQSRGESLLLLADRAQKSQVMTTDQGMNSMPTVATIKTCAALFIASLFLEGCGGSNANSRAADEKALNDLVDRTVSAADRRDIPTYGKYYAPKAILALPGRPISEVAGPLKIVFPPGYAIQMVTARTEISQGGDLGYALGTYEQTAPDRSGKLTHTAGKWMSVFQKQKGSSWRAIADTYNVDPPT